MKNFETMPSFNGVAAGSKATLDFPIGKNYHGVLLTRGGTTFTHDHLGNIKVLADGVPIHEISAAHIDDVQQFDGLQAGGANLSYIDFERAGLLTQAWVEATALPSYLYRTLQMEVNISSSASAPTLTAKALRSGVRLPPEIIKRRSFTRNPSGAGTFEVSDLPTGDPINRILIHAASDNINDVTLKRDNAIVFERTAAENDYMQTNGVKTPQSNWYMIDPTERGHGNQAIVTANVSDFRLEFDMAGADTLTIYVDYIGVHNSGN